MTQSLTHGLASLLVRSFVFSEEGTIIVEEPFIEWVWNVMDAFETVVYPVNTIATGLDFNEDKSILYNCDNHNNLVEAWTIPTPGDVSSINVVSDKLGSYTFDASTETDDLSDIQFKRPAFNVMWLLGNDTQEIIHYDLSVAGNQSTAVEDTDKSADLSTWLTNPSAFEWINDGTELQISDLLELKIYVFTVPTPYVPAGLVNVPSKTADLSSLFTSGAGIPKFRCFRYRDSGRLLYISGQAVVDFTLADILVLDLSTPYDPSTFTLNDDKSWVTQSTKVGDFIFDEDTQKIYITKTGAGTVYTSVSGGLALSVTPLEFTITPQNVSLISNPILVADVNTYILTLQDVGLTTEVILEADSASYILTPQDVITSKTHIPLVADVNAYILTLQDVTLVPPLEGWSQVGSAFSVTGGTAASDIVGMTTGRIAMLNNVEDEIQAFTWNGSSFSSLGNPFSLTIGSDNEVCRLVDNSIMAGSSGASMQRYDFDGTDFSTVGNSVNFGNDDTSITGCTQTRVMAVVRTDGLVCYDFSSPNWTQTGNSFTTIVPSFHRHSICVLDNTNDAERVAVLDNGNIGIYDFDGTDFSQVGNLFTSAPSADNLMRLATISGTEFALLSNDEILRYYSFDGSDITAGDTLDLTTINASSNNGYVGELDGADVVVYERGAVQMYTFRFN